MGSSPELPDEEDQGDVLTLAEWNFILVRLAIPEPCMVLLPLFDSLTGLQFV